jgi:excisionase family DNA binding protein
MKKPDRFIIEKAIVKAFGNLSTAAKSLAVERATLYRWIEQEGLEQAVIEGRNRRLDFAESMLDKGMQDGNMTAIIFYLKTQGKSRGYVERQELTGADGKKLFEVQILDDSI